MMPTPTLVSWGSPVFLGAFESDFGAWLQSQAYAKCVVIVDAHVQSKWAERLADWQQKWSVEYIVCPSGERHKNLRTCEKIWNELLLLKADRHTLIVNLGGGVTGDLGGFCTATFMRGLPFVQAPTTLLSQVDASIGGKLGVDFQGIKNLIGVIRQPEAVFIDPSFLTTLPPREIRSGFAEIVKHALIADAEYWHEILKIERLPTVDWSTFILPSLCIKNALVEADPLEKNIRKALNFGHTVGHAIESWSLMTRQPLRHGEAIAVGMVCEAWISTKIAGLPEADFQQIAHFIFKIFGRKNIDTQRISTILEFMQHDKKNRNGKLNFTLIPSIGKYRIGQEADERLVAESLRVYSNFR